MRFLILDTYYSAFQRFALRCGAVSTHAPFATQRDQWLRLAFGTSDFYSRNLRSLGHQAEDLIVNCEPLQYQWAREYAPLLAASYHLLRAVGRVRSWLKSVLHEQIRRIRPDVLYVQDINWTDAALLREIRPFVSRMVIGQTAYELRVGLDLSPYDLIITSFPHFVESFRRIGLRSTYLPLAFESSLATAVRPGTERHDVVFIGSISDVHRHGTAVLERVAAATPLQLWGPGVDSLGRESPLVPRYRGEAWGLKMFEVLASSRIALNRHSRVASTFANNMRLFESTGMGTMLVTDHKENIAELFTPGSEVVTYRSAEECVELVRHYLDNERDRATIAQAGQHRTLKEHTYLRRMEQLLEIIRRAEGSPVSAVAL